MATSGYLISRAAERPPILSLMVTIVAVQFFGIGRPFVRYLERLASHDMALRVLGRLRARFYRADRAAGAGASSTRYRKGDLLSRMVADVDALQNLYLRGLEPPLVALLAGAVSVGAAAALLPAAGLVLAGGLLVGGAGRARARRVARQPAGPPAGGRPRTAVGRARRVARAARPSSSRSAPSRPRSTASAPPTGPWSSWPAATRSPSAWATASGWW